MPIHTKVQGRATRCAMRQPLARAIAIRTSPVKISVLFTAKSACEQQPGKRHAEERNAGGFGNGCGTDDQCKVLIWPGSPGPYVGAATASERGNGPV